MSISHIWSKIKGIGRESVETADRRALYGALVSSLTGILCFFLGRTAYLIEARAPVELKIVDMPKAPAGGSEMAIKSVPEAGERASGATGERGSFVASKNGKRYYPAGCLGAKSISEANRVRFRTKEEAEKAGYTPSTTCKP